MKPLNEKERSLAFLQFIVLLVLTIILSVFLAFFPFRLNKKHLKILTDTNKKLENDKLFLSGLSFKIDSLVTIIKKMDKAEASDIIRVQNEVDEVLKEFNTDDSTSVSALNKSLKTVFNNWSTDKEILQKTNEYIARVKELEGDKKQLEKEVSNWKDKYNEASRVIK